MKKLSLLILPLLALTFSSCNEDIKANSYKAINDQEAIMQEYYRQHTSNQSNLTQYVLNKKLTYDPTYDVFGELVPENCPLGSYYESNEKNDINVYSGYLISKDRVSLYLGNRNNVGVVTNYEDNQSYWFKEFEDENEKQKELIVRNETKDNDLTNFVEDYRTGRGVDNANISHYFSNNINTEYKNLFEPVVQPVNTTTRRVYAYYRSTTEIVETYKEVNDTLVSIQNPTKPGDENRMTVTISTNGERNFKYIQNIGWVGTNFTESISYQLISDFDFNKLSEPHVIKTLETSISYTYSTNVQPYTGEPFVFQEKDENIENYRPTLYEFDGDNYIALDYEAKNVSFEYKQLKGDFAGLAYQLSNVTFEKDKNYSFASKIDTEGEEPNYETIGFRQVKENANGTLVDSKVEGHNLMKTIDKDATYEFIVLIPTFGNRSVITHLSI